jgi:hypothetical protein
LLWNVLVSSVAATTTRHGERSRGRYVTVCASVATEKRSIGCTLCTQLIEYHILSAFILQTLPLNNPPLAQTLFPIKQ